MDTTGPKDRFNWIKLAEATKKTPSYSMKEVQKCLRFHYVSQNVVEWWLRETDRSGKEAEASIMGQD